MLVLLRFLLLFFRSINSSCKDNASVHYAAPYSNTKELLWYTIYLSLLTFLKRKIEYNHKVEVSAIKSGHIIWLYYVSLGKSHEQQVFLLLLLHFIYPFNLHNNFLKCFSSDYKTDLLTNSTVVHHIKSIITMMEKRLTSRWNR